VIEEIENQKSNESSRSREHMANERTFLAWIRTSIGIMAFGFVVEKFALFIKQIALLLGKVDLPALSPPSSVVQGYSPIFGVFLVSLGVLICLLSFIKYKKVEQQIEKNNYQPSTVLDVLLTLSVLLIGIFLVIYLNNANFG
jgi:uncharacterized membrane protein YidH (DUF202 family)